MESSRWPFVEAIAFAAKRGSVVGRSGGTFFAPTGPRRTTGPNYCGWLRPPAGYGGWGPWWGGLGLSWAASAVLRGWARVAVGFPQVLSVGAGQAPAGFRAWGWRWGFSGSLRGVPWVPTGLRLASLVNYWRDRFAEWGL